MSRRAVLCVVVVAITVSLLGWAFRGVDWHGTGRVIAGAGPAVLLGLVPFGVGLLLDTSGVVLAARAAGLEARAVATLRVRVVSEALHFGAPGGVATAEATAVGLFTRWCGLTARQGIVVLGARKLLVMRAHALYLVLGALASAASLAAIGEVLHVRAMPLLAAASALIPLVASLLLGAALRRAAKLEPLRLHLSAPATAAFLAAWLIEAAETAVILRLVGAPLSVGAVLAVECTLSLARSAVAFVPGGLGVQDAGYGTALGALGVAPDQAAAFVLLKRAKELAWIAVGLATFAWYARSDSNGRLSASKARPSAPKSTTKIRRMGPFAAPTAAPVPQIRPVQPRTVRKTE